MEAQAQQCYEQFVAAMQNVGEITGLKNAVDQVIGNATLLRENFSTVKFNGLLTMLQQMRTQIENGARDRQTAAFEQLQIAQYYLFGLRNRFLRFAFILDNKFKFTDTIESCTMSALGKAQLVLGNSKVIGIVDRAKGLDERFASGKVVSLATSGAGTVSGVVGSLWKSYGTIKQASLSIA